MSVGLYIHVPFCRTRCDFCAFYLQIHRPDSAAGYVASLTRELALHTDLNSLSGRRLSTVYFGGGTPTTLEPEQLCHIVGLAKATFGFEDDVEVSVEAHPDTVTESAHQRLAENGFNHISFGLQSLHQTQLIAAGRLTV